MIFLHVSEGVLGMKLEIYQLLLPLLHLHQVNQLMLADWSSQSRIPLMPEDLGINRDWWPV